MSRVIHSFYTDLDQTIKFIYTSMEEVHLSIEPRSDAISEIPLIVRYGVEEIL